MQPTALKHLIVCIHFLTYLPAWITKFPTMIQLKNLLCCELLFSFLLNRTRALDKQQQDTLLSYRLEIEGSGIFFAKETHRPQVTNSPMYIEVINFCGSQPCSSSRGQRCYGIIELKPRTSVRKLFYIKILQTVTNYSARIKVPKNFLSIHRRNSDSGVS